MLLSEEAILFKQKQYDGCFRPWIFLLHNGIQYSWKRTYNLRSSKIYIYIIPLLLQGILSHTTQTESLGFPLPASLARETVERQKLSSSVGYEIYCTILKWMERREKRYIRTRHPEDVCLT